MKIINKHLITGAMIFGLMPTFSMADPAKDAKQTPCYKQEFKHEKGFYKDLDLTKTQQEAIRGLRQSKHQNEFAIKQKYWQKLPQAERDAMQQELETNKKEITKSIRELLNKEQQAKFDVLQNEMQKRHEQKQQKKADKALKQTK